MEEVLTRIVERRFPELTGGYHLPRFARVLAIADPPTSGGLCDEFRPRYAVDLGVLTPDGEVDPELPPLLGVALPLPSGGDGAGFFGFPEEGTTVVVSFAYGLPSKPFVLQILPHGLVLPSLPKGDHLWQQSEAVQQRADAEGNWTRKTDAKIFDRSVDREIEALDNRERYQSSEVNTENQSNELVGGMKKIEALGSLKLLSGGSASLAGADNLHLASGRDLNLMVRGNSDERIQGLRRSVAQIGQRLESPKTWIGSEHLNVLSVVCELLELVQDMASQLAGHVHGKTPPPGNAAAFSANAAKAQALGAKLKAATLA